MNHTKKLALITGISGQDGRYCSNLLLSKGYEVVGTTRDLNSAPSDLREMKGVRLVEWDLINKALFVDLLKLFKPIEIYNFAGMTSSATKFDSPSLMTELNGLAVIKILESILEVDPNIRFCQSSSAEMFGNNLHPKQTEKTALTPRNPYGIAKILAHNMVNHFRTHHGLFACSAILYNHESPIRPPHFVSRKISQGVAKIKLGLANSLELGNIDLPKDWSFAGDSVNAMWMMLQTDQPDDYIVSSGNRHTPRDFCDIAFNYVELNYSDFVTINEEFIRSTEPGILIGDNTKLKNMGWSPKTSFTSLVELMVQSDLDLIKNF